ncbi:MAG: thymidine phosphorylase [Rhodobacteraceae bacterium]|nr:thymidine phosphorylase [Paracoccaceae bacterium]
MDARAVLASLRKGEALSRDQIRWFAGGLASKDVDDAQAGAFAMGICRNPMTVDARVALTMAMRDTGRVLHWDLPGPVVDKHSTGGVGDCISLTLGPAIAALGAYIPMLSGRGLGHTGGTLDKLEAIPGLSTEMSGEAFQRVVRDAGCALVAASADIAPADRRLYAIRDVTSTVESIDLITASILSKKLAGGVGPLVLDVKTGSGAFMKSIEDSEALARSLVTTANSAAGPAGALITDMSQPNVPSVGNALEIMEVMLALTDPDESSQISILTAELGGELLRLAGMAESRAEGARQVLDAMRSGAAAERFGRMVAAKGGPVDFVERWRDRLPSAPVVREVNAPHAGTVAAIDGHALGMGVVHLGGGRLRAGQGIDPSVGLSDVAMIGDPVEAGDPLAIVHGATEEEADAIARELTGAFTLGEGQIDPPPLIYKDIA